MRNTDLLLDDLLGKVPPKTVNLDISKLHPFEGHPYKVLDNEDMEALVESIRTQGVLTPLVVRQTEEDAYEIISGHRRLHACKKAGITTVPALIYSLDRNAAAIALVEIPRMELMLIMLPPPFSIILEMTFCDRIICPLRFTLAES